MTEAKSPRQIRKDIAFVNQAADTWQSFWDLGKPERAADFLLQEFGANAAKEAAYAALTADADGRPDDYRYWVAVFRFLSPSDPGPWTPNPVPVPAGER